MKQYYNTGTKVDNTNIIKYAKGIKRGSDRIWNTEQLLKKLDKAGVRYTVSNSKNGRVISVDKNAYENNNDIKRYYDDRNRLYNDSTETLSAKRAFYKTSRKAVTKMNDYIDKIDNKFRKRTGNGLGYAESYLRFTDKALLDNSNEVDDASHIEQTSGMVEEFGSLPGKAEFLARGGSGLNMIPQKIVEISKSTGNDIAANKYYQKYKKLVRDNIIQGRGFDFGRDAGTVMISREPTADLYVNGKHSYHVGAKIRVSSPVGFAYEPTDSFRLVNFNDKQESNTNSLTNGNALENNKKEPAISDTRNEVAAQKTFSKPKEEESKAPKFTSIGRSSMGNMLELYNEKGNVVESMSPTAKNVRKVMKHLGVGDDNSSDDDVKTWFKDFSKQTDKGKRITFNTTSKKK